MSSNDVESQSQKIAEVLNRAVADTLDRKRRLGQYAVMWRDGRTIRVEAADLPALPIDNGARLAESWGHERHDVDETTLPLGLKEPSS